MRSRTAGLQRLIISLVQWRRCAELEDGARLSRRFYAVIVVRRIHTFATAGRQQLLVDDVVDVVAQEAAVPVTERHVNAAAVGASRARKARHGGIERDQVL